MKKSTILQIFNGEYDLQNMPPIVDEKYSKQATDIYEKLQVLLSEDMFKLFNDFIDKDSLAHCDVPEAYFREGFKLGLRVGIECMED